MTEFYLIDALKDFIQKVLNGEKLEAVVDDGLRPEGSLWDTPDQHTEQSELSDVKVYDGFLPPLEDSHVPFVYIRPTSATVNAGRTDLTVVLTVGVYAEDFKGYKDAMHVTRRITSALNSLKNNHLAKRFERTNEMSWSWNATDDTPYWSVDITTEWYIYTDVQTVEDFL